MRLVVEYFTNATKDKPNHGLPADLEESFRSVTFKFVGVDQVCLRCGKTFKAHRQDHKYCSGRCREAFLKYLQRHPEQREEKPPQV